MVRSEKGFTLIEVIAVLVITAIIFSIVVKFGGGLTGSAANRAAEVEVAALNRAAVQVWTLHKMESLEHNDDSIILEKEIASNPHLVEGGVAILIDGKRFAIQRTASTVTSPPEWRLR
jgi:prepilin-type N-terminal cleavage/methylation domain-containing protein